MKNQITRDGIVAFLKREKPMLHQKFHVKEIGLFGSFARGEANEKSDIDFLVVIDAPLENYRASKEELHDYLKNIFNREVDLANPHSLKPHYKNRILSQAINT